ncbi:SDR family NAD(P)-dependent oxidoreductase [Mycolicibacterium mengxianglii]|uniref:SDR family NAD(P)-dependent oxidoreductase n=1 Tax=Mycolicibacterium mengxianglii TaxID=2736649 RepID=UPI0018D06D14|nr:SDR family oxidoreductase [Mycolicibacterium mengxianglii]
MTTTIESKRLAGKVAIVTGAADGIGRGIADALSQAGATVRLTDVKDPSASLLARQSFSTHDVTSEESWADTVNAVVRDGGGLDVLVNNAAVIDYQALDEVVVADWERTMRVNVTGPMLGIRESVPHLRARGKGSVVNIASSWGIVAVAGIASYHASKGAVRMITRNAAMTYAPDRIRVNSIIPGIVRTPLTEKQPDVTAGVVAQTPLGLAEPYEIGYGAVFLASDESSQVTGTDLVMDGGYTLH